ncbi:gluconokinase [Chitinilyticum piscinae]|uniref:Gluconokinase n=1 Tax=Chitinilyticum piscinae TaxID=2866724 RepID=A0A8J7FL05_9NEIS|nr:gluconokinase [Chitinilyticum piscinae]MBE9609992.1 gluconokinase [Chitinilyticum piscinae]
MSTPQTHKVYVLMGVSGSGKSAVASAIACHTECAFLDGDFLHPRANIQKMASGTPLDDDDRAPWLAALNDAAFAMQRTNAVSVIVCSALKRRYRDRLREGNPGLSFIYLRGDFATIEARLAARQGHFQKAGMLTSQFAALEEPQPDEAGVFVVDINQPLEGVIADTLSHIRSQASDQGA